MMLQLNQIKAHPGARRNEKRKGKGSGSGNGKTAGKGHKGQSARKSGGVGVGFEGGQTPLYRRLPKVGFTNVFRKTTAILNVADLERLDLSALSDISLETLYKAGFVKGRSERLAILGTGELKKKLSVKAHRVSASAKEKIEKAGGSVEILKH